MAISLAQTIVAGTITTPGAHTIAYGANVTKGNLLCAVFISGISTFSSITDTVGSDWASPISTSAATVMWGIAGGSGANTVTLNSGGGPDSACDAYLFEVTGFPSTPGLLASKVATGSSGAPTCGPLTVSANCFLLAGIRYAGSASGGGIGWTALITSSANLVEYILGPTAGPYTASGTPADSAWTDAFGVFGPQNAVAFGCNA